MSRTSNRVVRFLRNNLAYIILALCIIAIGVATTLAIVLGNRDTAPEINNEVIDPLPDVPDEPVIDPTPDVPDEPVVDPTPDVPSEPVVEVVTFIMPVSAPTTVEHYSEQMVFNSTLGRYSTHKAIDFFAEEGTSVLAVWGGTVESVKNDLLKGITVTIDHGNGLKTVYNSLGDADTVSAGQKVNKGDVIGYVSVTNRQESANGAHLHFEVYEEGVIIDPAKYLTIDEK